MWQMKINDFFKLLRDDMGVGVYFDAVRGVINFRVFADQLLLHLKRMTFRPICSSEIILTLLINQG